MTVERRDVGTLELGAGLEVLVSAALESATGDELDVACASRSIANELVGWARVVGHEVLDEHRDGAEWVVRLRRCPMRLSAANAASEQPELVNGTFPTAALRRSVGLPAAHADSTAGLIPLGAAAEPVSQVHNWVQNTRDHIWADRLATLNDRTASAQWSATVDIPWDTATTVRGDRQRATGQVATYIAQNEYAAYYVPARYLAQIHPTFLEVLMWLAGHVHDEARHIEVFTKRALLGGAPAQALAATELSLSTLLDERDFSVSTLLLNVLGEGTFLDLLSFIVRHAPDAAMATAARLAHRDERRHVQFGIAHIRRRLRTDLSARVPLIAAVERRAAKLVTLDGLSPVVGESLVVMSSPSMQPADISDGGQAVRALMTRMHRNRAARLRAVGFDYDTAMYLSELHTPNLM